MIDQTLTSSVPVVLRMVVGASLAAAGCLKLDNPSSLRPAFQSLGLAGNQGLVFAAWLLSASEMSVGLWLVVGLRIYTGLLASVFLLASFSVALVVLVRTGYRGSCRCFGVLDTHPIGPVQVVRNVLLLAAAAFAWMRSSDASVVRLPIWQLPPSQLLASLIVLAAATAIYILALEVYGFYRLATST